MVATFFVTLWATRLATAGLLSALKVGGPSSWLRSSPSFIRWLWGAIRPPPRCGIFTVPPSMAI